MIHIQSWCFRIWHGNLLDSENIKSETSIIKTREAGHLVRYMALVHEEMLTKLCLFTSIHWLMTSPSSTQLVCQSILWGLTLYSNAHMLQNVRACNCKLQRVPSVVHVSLSQSSYFPRHIKCSSALNHVFMYGSKLATRMEVERVILHQLELKSLNTFPRIHCWEHIRPMNNSYLHMIGFDINMSVILCMLDQEDNNWYKHDGSTKIISNCKLFPVVNLNWMELTSWNTVRSNTICLLYRLNKTWMFSCLSNKFLEIQTWPCTSAARPVASGSTQMTTSAMWSSSSASDAGISSCLLA